MNQEVGVQTAPSGATKASAHGTYKIPALRVLSEITSSLSSENNLDSLLELFFSKNSEPVMVQAFLPAVSEGDKRIVLIDGEPVGAINRRPKAGQVRSNLVVGGTAEATELSAADKKICERIGPELKRRGLVLTGIDVIGGRLTEVNVTSPTGLQALKRLSGIDATVKFWDVVESKLAARGLERHA